MRRCRRCGRFLQAVVVRDTYVVEGPVRAETIEWQCSRERCAELEEAAYEAACERREDAR